MDRIEIMRALTELGMMLPPDTSQFYDIDSEELIDEKLEVLKALKEGKAIKDIPLFYDILELYPKDTDTVKTDW